MLIFSKAPLFLWAEAVATACYTQNQSLIHTLHNKTPYELVHDKKLDLSFLHIMADVNAPVEQAHVVAPPIRTDEQILPRIRWVPIGKSNCYLDAEKSQSNPIYKIANNGGYKCQLDEQWFNLTKDTLRVALQITPVNNNKAFSSLPTQDTLINLFTNWVINKKAFTYIVVTNDSFQPCVGEHSRTNHLNMPYEGKDSGVERLKSSVLQILGGIINRDTYRLCGKGCGKNSLNPSILSLKTKRIWHNTLRERRKPLSLKVAQASRYLLVKKFSDPDLCSKICIITKNKLPTKPKEKKRKQAKETTEATPPAKRAKAGKVADTQRAIEESLKDAHGAPRGPLPPMVFRETDTRKFQPLLEVEGKGKEKVGAEQAAQVLLNLQTLKKKSPVEQYIFQRRTFAPTKPSGHDESSFLYVELGLTESDTESDKEMPLVVKSGD
ncbi:hypothetical protein Tco_0691414 [Tanacetum coccineum]